MKANTRSLERADAFCRDDSSCPFHKAEKGSVLQVCLEVRLTPTCPVKSVINAARRHGKRSSTERPMAPCTFAERRQPNASRLCRHTKFNGQPTTLCKDGTMVSRIFLISWEASRPQWKEMALLSIRPLPPPSQRCGL